MVTADAVIDIRADSPRADDRFFVDTNVWRFLAYSKFTTGNAPSNPVAQAYSAYIQRSLKVGAKLLWSPLSYTELASIVEKAEFDLYNARNPQQTCFLKDFRMGTAERAAVVAEMQAAWGQVTTIGEPIATPTDISALQAAIKLFEDCPLDGYDVFFVNGMRCAGVTCIITHDIDFTHVPGLRVFTGNGKALHQAGMFPKVLKQR